MEGGRVCDGVGGVVLADALVVGVGAAAIDGDGGLRAAEAAAMRAAGL